MPLSLRMPPEKEELIKRAATKAGKTKTAFVLEAVDEKLGITKDREKLIRDLAGWISHNEANELRKSLEVFNRVDEEDWN